MICTGGLIKHKVMPKKEKGPDRGITGVTLGIHGEA